MNSKHTEIFIFNLYFHKYKYKFLQCKSHIKSTKMLKFNEIITFILIVIKDFQFYGLKFFKRIAEGPQTFCLLCLFSQILKSLGNI